MEESNSLDDSPSRQAQAQTRTHSGGGGGGDAPSNPSQPQPQAQSQSQSQREGEEVDETKKEEEELIEKAQKWIDKITSSPDNPNPTLLHALSSLLETQESLYMKENGDSSFNNSRASHNIGRLGSLVRDNDEFFELISSRFLSETRYSTSIQAAAARLLMTCSLTWITLLWRT